MNIKKFIEIMSVAEKLKNNTRHSRTSSNRHESVAEHSWRLSLMAYLVKDEFPDADINKVILMSIIHDLGEAITGDIPAFKKTASDEIIENIKVFSSLKKDVIYGTRFITREEARKAIISYIEGFYNSRRLHSTLGYKSPREYINDYYRKNKKVA